MAFRFAARHFVILACCWIALAGGILGPGGVLAHQGQGPPATGPPVDSAARRAEIDSAVRRADIDEAFRLALDQLADQCDEQGLAEQAETTRGWMLKRDPFRQYIFLPPTRAEPPPADDAPANVQRWFAQFRAARVKYAQSLLQLAEAAVAADRGAEAYQLWHEILVHDPDCHSIRTALGYRRDIDSGGWMQTAVQTRSQVARRRQALLGWEKGSYWTIRSPHFEIHSAAGETAGIELARSLERWQAIWRQVFFDYWSSPRNLANWLAGNGADRSGTRTTKHTIFLFRDRDHYLKQLADVSGIALSTGYYNDRERASFFYAGESVPASTWRHELVHQLFQENGRARNSPADTAHAWLIEGIAMYFESLQDHGRYVSLGGLDAERLQFARLRCKREGFFLPFEKMDLLGLTALQQHPQVRPLYSQAAGMSHFLMTFDRGTYRSALIQLIDLVYRGRSRAGSLAKLTEQDLDQLDRQYAGFLDITRQQVAEGFTCYGQTGLALGRCGLTARELKSLAVCAEALEWLELSSNPIDDQALETLRGFDKLRQLFLDGTAVTDAGMSVLGQLTQLEELDLAGTRVGDAGLRHLAGLTRLKILDLRNTRVTHEGRQALAEQHPDLEILQ